MFRQSGKTSNITKVPPHYGIYVNGSGKAGRKWYLITHYKLPGGGKNTNKQSKKLLQTNYDLEQIFCWSVDSTETWTQHWFQVFLHFTSPGLSCSRAALSRSLCAGVIIAELMDGTANTVRSSSRSALCIAAINIFLIALFSYPNFSCTNDILINQIQNWLIQQLEGLYLSLFSNTTPMSALSLKNSSELVNQRIIKTL